MAKKPKKKRVISEAQKAAMTAGRRAAKARKLAELKNEPEFEPSQVQASDIEAPTPPVSEPETPDLIQPPASNEVQDVNVPTSQSVPLTAPTAFTPEQLMTMMLQMQQQINMLQAQTPGLATATPEQKLNEISRMTPAMANQARVGVNGVQGVVYRYSVEPSYYPDPTDRLLSEPSLARFAMKENYIFKWSVEGEEYDKNGVHFAEPRFTLELYRRLYGDDGMPMLNPATGRPVMALVARQLQHEDEFTTRAAASRLGIANKFGQDEEGFRLLMDEIRYWRMQQWLFSLFTPPKITQFARKSRTQVIDGKAVEVFDTEQLTDHDKGVAAASTLQSQTGVGSVAVPQAARG